MSLKNVNTVLATVCTLFVLYLGLSFILAPEASTQGVGLPTWPADAKDLYPVGHCLAGSCGQRFANG